jgi:hypothetical protein
MSRKRRLILTLPAGDDGPPPPIGSFDEVIVALAPYNIAPDGADSRSSGTAILYGPGLTIEIATGLELISQLLVTLVEEDIAWPVLMRLCKALGWSMMDPDTGRAFGPHA